MKRKPFVALLGLLLAVTLLTVRARQPQNSIDQQVERLLKRMTLEEKVGQMTQITLSVVSKPRKAGSFSNVLDLQKLRTAIVQRGVGSILNTGGAANTAANWQDMISTMQKMATQETRLGIPILYGIDAIHGSNYIKEATLFPQSIAMAATWNRELVRKEGEITALETRAVGIPWNFNPVLGLGRQPLWSRIWETYGEDAYAAAQFGREYIWGLQGKDGNVARDDRVAGCMKHYAGYSVPLSGHDRTPAWIPIRILRELFLPPFHEAVRAGVLTVMVNSAEINGVPAHASSFLLTRVLRDEWHFRGLVVSDWEDVKHLYTRDHVAASPKDAVRMAVEAGLDMSMVPFDYSFADYLIQLVKEGTIPESRIDQSVRRILRVKYRLGLFDDPFPRKEWLSRIGTPEHKAVSLQAAREAVTLLKNDGNVLPLNAESNILVTGPTAHLKSVLNGGWSYVWQGNEERLYPKDDPTLLQAIRARAKGKVTYVPGADFEQAKESDRALAAAKKADVIVACLGEPAYCETPGNINDLSLPAAQIDLVRKLEETGKPVVIVLLEGRPRIIRPIVEKARGIIMGYLPGPQGAQAIAEVLFGETNPSGKLPITYPRYVNDFNSYDYKYSRNFEVNRINPQWPFGFGLSYTTFKYSDLQLSAKQLKNGQTLRVSVHVTNTGKRPGKEAVLLYLSDLVRSVSPPVKRLKGFEKIALQPGETKTVTFSVTPQALSFVNAQNKRVIEPGTFKVQIGPLSQTFELTE